MPLAQDPSQGCNRGGSGGLCSSQDLTERGPTSGLTRMAAGRSQLLHIGKEQGRGGERVGGRGEGGGRGKRQARQKSQSLKPNLRGGIPLLMPYPIC